MIFQWHVDEVVFEALTMANALRFLGNTIRDVQPYLLEQAAKVYILHKAYYNAETWWPGRTRPQPPPDLEPSRRTSQEIY